MHFKKWLEYFLEAIIIIIIAFILVGLFGAVAASVPYESEFWWEMVKKTLLVITVGSFIGSVVKLYANEIRIYKVKMIVFNIAFFYMMVASWRSAGESLIYGILLLVLFVTCIIVGIRYRAFIQEESFRPKTKVGKIVVSFGLLGPTLSGFVGYNVGRSEDANLVLVFGFPIIACLLILFFNSALKQIEDREKEQ